MANFNDHQLPYDEEAEEIRRMKEECDRMAHEMLEQIDALLVRIDGILSKDRELYGIGCGKDLTLEEQAFLMHGNQRLAP